MTVFEFLGLAFLAVFCVWLIWPGTLGWWLADVVHSYRKRQKEIEQKLEK
jgi:hypothetical protein